jgi:hypothetical protein
MHDHTPTTRAIPAGDGALTTSPASAVHEPDAIEADDRLHEEADQLPSRPRRRLLTPLPVALVIALMTACGFIAGVLVEKGQGGSGSSSGLAGRLAGLQGRGGGAGAQRAFAGAPGAGGAGTAVGQVAFVQGSTLYVTDTQGNTVKVSTSRASSVTKSVKSTVAGIHPGDSVTVTGAPGPNGAITAESIRVGEGFGGGLAALLGGSRSGASAGSGAGRSSSGAGAGEPALFGNGG